MEHTWTGWHRHVPVNCRSKQIAQVDRPRSLPAGIFKPPQASAIGPIRRPALRTTFPSVIGKSFNLTVSIPIFAVANHRQQLPKSNENAKSWRLRILLNLSFNNSFELLSKCARQIPKVLFSAYAIE